MSDIEVKGEETVELGEEMKRRRRNINPDELVAPGCMFWGMIAGFAVLIGIAFMWGIANLDKIAQ